MQMAFLLRKDQKKEAKNTQKHYLSLQGTCLIIARRHESYVTKKC
jgi:hypothetical protein